MSQIFVRRTVRVMLGAAAVALILGSLHTLQAALLRPAEPLDHARTLVWQTLPWLVWALLVPAIFITARRFELEMRRWPLALFAYAALGIPVVLLHAMLTGTIAWALGAESAAPELADALTRVLLRETGLEMLPFVVIALIYHFGAFVDRLQRAKTMLAHMESQRTDSLRSLAGGVAHELNGLLTELVGHLAILRAPGDSSEPARELEAIDGLVERSTRLGRELQWMGMGVAVRVAPLDPITLLRDIEQAVSPLARAPIQLGSEGEPFTTLALGDEARLREIVSNIVLLLDGRSETPRPTRVTTERIHERGGRRRGQVAPPRTYCRIGIHNPGAELDDDAVHRLMEPGLLEKDGRMGLELTLAAARGVLEQMDGLLTIETGGTGTHVGIYLPDAAESPAPDQAVPSHAD